MRTTSTRVRWVVGFTLWLSGCAPDGAARSPQRDRVAPMPTTASTQPDGGAPAATSAAPLRRPPPLAATTLPSALAAKPATATPTTTAAATETSAAASQAHAPPPALAPCDDAALPRTKMGLIMAVDEVLRTGDAKQLARLWLDAATLGRHCGRMAPDALAEPQQSFEDARRRAASHLADCLALTDWRPAERLALNYGSDVHDPPPGCDLRSHEKSELYYGIGNSVFKVTMSGAVVIAGRHGLGGGLRCTKKRGSAADMRSFAARLGRRCPRLPWRAITQARHGCPPL